MGLFKESKHGELFWVIGVALFLFFIFLVGWHYYDQWKGERNVERLAEFLREIEKAKFEKQSADKIGGKTPQETLDLFIAAVEKGDYELASKYFVIEKQEEWKRHLPEIAAAQKINTFLDPLREAKKSKGSYLKEDRYFIDDPVSIEYIRYPSGNWKIEEI